VTFSDQESLKKAQSANVMIYGLKADCHEVVSKKVLKGKSEIESSSKIFVGGITQSTSKDVLQKYFANFGEILEARILYDGNTGKSRGFAFIVFKNKESKQRVLEQKIHTLKGKVIEIKQYQSEGSLNKKNSEKSQKNRKNADSQKVQIEKMPGLSGIASKADS